ncbi:MAG: flavodoxin domain-containing protein [Candidatus Bathyarchaeota archaeon]
MPYVIVIYDSKTGNTEKMAKAVVEGAELVKDVTVTLLKVGSPFSISKLNTADAIILGSPTRYGNVTSEMKEFLDAVKEHVDSKKLKLSEKIGGVFASYAWDGGWVTSILERTMNALGIHLITSSVSAVDNMGAMGIRINEETLQKCKDLGKDVAQKIGGKLAN